MAEHKQTAYEDYAQSANALFHFVSKDVYLKSILLDQALKPRYCVEDVEYLNLKRDEKVFLQIAVLQKCFCDIPLPKLTARSDVHFAQGEEEKLEDDEKADITSRTTHTDLYGRFGVAFSKAWGEKRRLLPIHYVNENSSYVADFSRLFSAAIDQDDLSESVAEDILNRLSYIKPLRGTMDRKIPGETERYVKIWKNFHDEREWRYVPDPNEMARLNIGRVIANDNVLKLKGMLKLLNDQLTTEGYKDLWIHYDYDDIRYIIVPDKEERNKFIEIILGLSSNRFGGVQESKIRKAILISKILVLDEMRKDM